MTLDPGLGTREPTHVRPMDRGDSVRVAALATELGYPISADVLAERFGALLGGDSEAVLVAEVAGEVMGWIHIRLFVDLLEAPTIEIRGLVVDARYRGLGIGQRLVAAAEAQARDRGIGRLRVTSNIIRDRAHRFYERLGYERVKTSLVFVKMLGTTAEETGTAG